MDRKNKNLIILAFSTLLIIIAPSFSIAASSLSQGQQLKHGEVLLSESGSFKLGFFVPENVNSSYLAIWYSLVDEMDPNPVWIANRDTPISGDSGVLGINDEGSLEIKYGKGNSNTISLYTVENVTKTIATLQDDGNFVLLEDVSSSSNKRVLWRSFDYPTDTLLPGMKLGLNKRTGQTWSLTSWRSSNLPALGSFTLGVDPNNTSQLVIWWQKHIYWTSKGWQENDGNFKFTNLLSPSYFYERRYGLNGYYSCQSSVDYLNGYRYRQLLVDYSWHFNSTEDEVYFSYSVNKNQLFLGPKEQVPSLTLTFEGDVEEGLGDTIVSCSPYSQSYGYNGCAVERLPECRSFDAQYFYESRGFMSTEGYKFKESENLTRYDCEAICRKNCTCIAYASTNDLYGTGCEIWSSNTTFIVDGNGRQIHIHSEPPNEGTQESRWWISLIVLGGLIATPILCYLCYVIGTKCKIEVDKIVKQTMLIREIGGRTVASIIYDITKRHMKDEKANDEIHVFSFKRVASATKNFSAENKLGEGGFGPVYKGKMHDGQEIAIKRLSKRSGQGLVEFKNEAKLIAKLQHTNLVRLLGFCLQRGERMLIYEYMPNKSLDFYIFDSEKRNMLNWTKRFSIIEGIAQGLVYLHIYSRLTVIHRDLKASNILLDNHMNPKISDFGMARIFELKGIEENTSRIVGTYGYMSPEYAMNGIVSIKTDIFSFGVLLLEIVSGKKNNSRYHFEYPLNLIGLAWQLWNEGRGTEMIDSSLLESCPTDEVLRCIQIGLLCVQDRASDRPGILEVVSMLSNETALLPSPNQPAFYFDTVEEEEPNGLEKPKTCSINEVTISIMDGRS